MEKRTLGIGEAAILAIAIWVVWSVVSWLVTPVAVAL
jgi:hypothetical protein